MTTTGSKIFTNAKVEAKKYRGAVDTWDSFIGDTPDRPFEVALYDLLQELIYQARKGNWSNPTEEKLKTAIGWESQRNTRYGGKYGGYTRAFAKQYWDVRTQLDQSSANIATEFRRQEFRDGLDAIKDPRERLRLVNSLLERLPATEQGRSVLLDIAENPSWSLHPKKHLTSDALDQYLNDDGAFDHDKLKSDSETLSVALDTITLVNNCMAGFTHLYAGSKKLAGATESFVELVKRFEPNLQGVDFDAIINAASNNDIATIAPKLDTMTSKLHAKVETYRTASKLQGVTEHLSVIGGMIDFYTVTITAMADPTLSNVGSATTKLLDTIKTIAGALESLTNTYKALKSTGAATASGVKSATGGKTEILKTFAGRFVGTLVGVWDITMNTISGVNRAKLGDKSASLGHFLQAGSIAIVGVFELVKVATSASLTGVGFWIGLAALVIGAIGLALTSLTQESELELLFEHCRFGTEWRKKSDSFFEKPDTPYFKWRDTVGVSGSGSNPWDTEPNVARQVSTFISKMTPLNLSVDVADSPGVRGDSSRWKQQVPKNDSIWPVVQGTIQFTVPSHISDNSFVVIRSLEKEPDGNRYHSFPLWYTRLNNGSSLATLFPNRDVPEEYLVHRPSNSAEWTLYFARSATIGSNTHPKPLQARKRLFGGNTLPDWIEVDVINGNVPSDSPIFEPETELFMTDHQIVLRDRVEVS